MNRRTSSWETAATLLLGAFAVTSVAAAWQAHPAFDQKASMARGKAIYDAQCVTCHREKGEGVKDVYPPLAKSDYLLANKARSIGVVVNGAHGAITVNRRQSDTQMLRTHLTHEHVRARLDS